jgi:hypothetical protein
MYASAEEVSPLDANGRHLLLARAVVACQEGPVALTGPSAAVMHGFTVYGHDLQTVHLIRLDRGTGRRQAGVNHHESMTDVSGAIEMRQGLATINAARTVWEMGRLSDLEGGVCTADSALRLMPELRDAIDDLGRRYQRHPDANRARLVIRLADGRSGSAGESVTRVQFYRYSVPKPDLQVEVRGRDGEFLGFSDWGWDGHRHLAEFDGKVKYLKYLREGETPSACVFREKRREDAMRAEFFGMTRFVWEMVMPRSARRTMERLSYHLEQSRRLYVIGRVA